MGCAETDNYAPVTDLNTIEPIPASGMYQVKRGESIYEIAWRYGVDYRMLAERNHLTSPYRLHRGEILYFTQNPAPVVKANVATAPIHHEEQPSRDAEPHFTKMNWMWPAQGRVIKLFSKNNKGINIAGKKGEPVYAAMPGKVVYCGDGIRGYGNLIILKHNNTYLSAYAHNQTIMVKEGEWVKQGQQIAKMGDSGANKVMLHFEIRDAGTPVNPLKVL